MVGSPRLALQRGEFPAIIVGGNSSTATDFTPRRYRGGYFFADWAFGWLDYLPFEQVAASNASTVRFARGLAGPVALHFGPNGQLYYLSYTRGEIRQIDYLR